MKVILHLLSLSILILGSCNQTEPRRPVDVRSGSFIQSSIERNKQLLESEEDLIAQLVEKDSLTVFERSSNGYWFSIRTVDSSFAYRPLEEDIVRIGYELRNLDSTLIYSREDIGILEFKVDKAELFPGMRTGIKLMRQGETASFYFPSSLGYGYHGDDDKIGPNVPLLANVSLLEITRDSINTTPKE